MPNFFRLWSALFALCAMLAFSGCFVVVDNNKRGSNYSKKCSSGYVWSGGKCVAKGKSYKKAKSCPPGHVWSDGKCRNRGKGYEKKGY